MSVKVSVIFPSRGRSSPLSESINSLLDNAEFPENVEILIAVDPDEGIDNSQFSAIFYTVPERYGYNKLHDYYNYLAVRAQGKWLFIWNDDVLMLTKGWDEIIRNQADALLWPYSSQDQGGNVFPIYPKAWADCVGHVALSPYVDLWTQEVAEKLPRRLRHVPIMLKHRRFDDETMSQGNGQGFPIRHSHYHQPEMFRERDTDAALICDLINNEPGNTQLVSILMPAVDSIAETISELISKANIPQETEFLVAAGDNHRDIRKRLEDAGVMGQTEVHWRHHIQEIRGFTHGTWIINWGDFEVTPGWDHLIRTAQ